MIMMARERNVQGIVLAGVHAWGESLLERICCRPLLPVAGRPLVWYVLDWLARGDIERTSVCANSDTGIFKRWLGPEASAGMALEYYADLMPRGPAGCVRDAAATSTADTFVVVDGTIVAAIDLAALLDAHLHSGAAVTVVTHQNADAPAAAEPAGIYVVSRTALEHVPQRGYQDIKEMLIPKLYEHGQRVAAYAAPPGSTLRVTGAASYLAVCARVLAAETHELRLAGRYNAIGAARVHLSAYLARSARLIGPVLIGPDCVVDEAATIVGPASLGIGCTVGRQAVVSRTVAWSGSHVAAGAVVDQSVLASDCRVEPHVVVRDTVCVPADLSELNHRQLYWGLPAEPAARRTQKRSPAQHV